VFVDDARHPEDYQGMDLFTDPDNPRETVGDLPPAGERPYPYAPCRKIRVRGLTTASGRKPRLSSNGPAFATTVVTEED
jgi:hypothetical protein